MVTDIVDLRVPRPGRTFFVVSGAEGFEVGCPLRVEFCTGAGLALLVTDCLFAGVDERGVDCLAVDLDGGLIGEVDLDPRSKGNDLFSLPRLLSIEAPALLLVEVATEPTEALGL